MIFRGKPRWKVVIPSTPQPPTTLSIAPVAPESERLAVTKGKIEHVADDEPLGNILRRKRPLSSEVIAILHGTNSAGRPFEPAREGIGIAKKLGIGISSKQCAPALEPAGHGRLQRIVGAFATSISRQATVRGIADKADLAVPEPQCSLAAGGFEDSSDPPSRLCRRRVMRICRVLRRLSHERVGDLVYVHRVLLKVYTVGTCVSDIRKESTWQLTLNIEVPLLYVSMRLRAGGPVVRSESGGAVSRERKRKEQSLRQVLPGGGRIPACRKVPAGAAKVIKPLWREPVSPPANEQELASMIALGDKLDRGWHGEAWSPD